jgi:putative ABC transport system permease protein
LLQESYRPAWWLWLVGLGAGAGGITLAGLLGTYRTVNTPPLVAIRANG